MASGFLRWLIYSGSVGAVLFVSAGTWRLPFAWAYLGVCSAIIAASLITIDPGLLEERLHPKPGGRDRLLVVVGQILYIAHWIIAGVDAGRTSWSSVAAPLQLGGLIGFASFMGLALWAMAVNPFFSPVVRIQQERGHRVITVGPYQFVRRPGYIGGILAFLCSGIALGSWWSLLPAILLDVLVIRRTVLEDEFLKAELDGYSDYAHRVRFRLLPLIW